MNCKRTFSVLNAVFIIVGLMAALVCAALASEKGSVAYYVSPTGNDRNSGTQSLPFKTIQKAASIVKPGDTVIVKDGVYTDTYAPGYMLYLRRSGTASNWITFKSENKWGAVLDGQDTNECVTFTKNSDYIRIEDFEIKNCSLNAIVSNDVPAAHHVYLYGNKIHHIASCAITFKSSNYWTIDSNIMYDLGLSPTYNGYAVYVSCDSSYATIINNISYDTDGWHYHLYRHGCLNPQQDTKIVNNTFIGESASFVGQIIVAAVSPNLLIENNIFYNPTTSAIRVITDNSGQNVIVRNNLTNVGSMCSGKHCRYCTFSNNQTRTDPSFVDPKNRNYHLRPNSPAKDKGAQSIPGSF